jgi:hypothetical protein
LTLDTSSHSEDGEEEKRAAVIDAVETVQVIAALLAGTGIAFLEDLTALPDTPDTPDVLCTGGEGSEGASLPLSVSFLRTLASLSSIDIAKSITPSSLLYYEHELIRFFVLLFVGLNLYGLITLSTQLYYLRQIMAKDITMFNPFVKATKDARYYAVKGCLYSMVSCVTVIGLKQISLRKQTAVGKYGGVAMVLLSFYCLQTMRRTNATFSGLRKKSKGKQGFKAGVQAVKLTNALKAMTPNAAAAAAAPAAAAPASASEGGSANSAPYNTTQSTKSALKAFSKMKQLRVDTTKTDGDDGDDCDDSTDPSAPDTAGVKANVADRPAIERKESVDIFTSIKLAMTAGGDDGDRKDAAKLKKDE